nr:carboxynorspermidine decarboxylase [Prolixibacteraceae bacterium]
MDYKEIPSPAYVLDEKLLRKNLELIKRVKDKAGIDIILAFKGFSMWSAFPIVREYIQGATASSLFEAKLCYEEMKSLAHVYSPVYHSAEFQELLKYSKYMVFNSVAQFNQFYEQTKHADHPISCGLRVNPEYSDVETDLYNPASPNSRLGITSDKLKELPQGVD